VKCRAARYLNLRITSAGDAEDKALNRASVQIGMAFPQLQSRALGATRCAAQLRAALRRSHNTGKQALSALPRARWPQRHDIGFRVSDSGLRDCGSIIAAHTACVCAAYRFLRSSSHRPGTSLASVGGAAVTRNSNPGFPRNSVAAYTVACSTPRSSRSSIPDLPLQRLWRVGGTRIIDIFCRWTTRAIEDRRRQDRT